METNISSYPEAETTIKNENDSLNSIRFQAFDLISKNEDQIITLYFHNSEIQKLYELTQGKIRYAALKEELCLVAIKNLFKKAEFLQLSLQLSENLITEDEFENEISVNPEKYVIDIKESENPEYIEIIKNIIIKIGKVFTIDEVSELFSIDVRSINKPNFSISN